MWLSQIKIKNSFNITNKLFYINQTNLEDWGKIHICKNRLCFMRIKVKHR